MKSIIILLLIISFLIVFCLESRNFKQLIKNYSVYISTLYTLQSVHINWEISLLYVRFKNISIVINIQRLHSKNFSIHPQMLSNYHMV